MQNNTKLKAGHCIITGISGAELRPEEKKFIEEEEITGVILFSHNYESPGQLAELINDIQKSRIDYPLFISVDHEGGRVQRFKRGFTHFPANLNLTKCQSPKLIYEVYRIMAEELRACGLNLNFAPCCDILTNLANDVIGDRAFGKTSEEVSKYVSAAIRGLQANGIIACAKHFVGHGRTNKDSHHDITVLKTPLDELKNEDFIPFIKASKSRVEMMMVSHLIIDAIDDTLPASLSPKVYRLIREYFKYNKLLITDDLDMKGITKGWTIEEASVRALASGSDMLIFRNMESAFKAAKQINNSLKVKELTKSDFHSKKSRIDEVKKKYLSNYRPVYLPSLESKLFSKEAQEILSQVSSHNSQPTA